MRVGLGFESLFNLYRSCLMLMVDLRMFDAIIMMYK